MRPPLIAEEGNFESDESVHIESREGVGVDTIVSRRPGDREGGGASAPWSSTMGKCHKTMEPRCAEEPRAWESSEAIRGISALALEPERGLGRKGG